MVLCNKLLKRAATIAAAAVMALSVLPAATGGNAFAGSKDSIGSLSWSAAVPYQTIMESVTSPVCWGSYVFVASADKLYKYDGNTGKLQGTASISPGAGRNKLAVAVAGDKILVTLKGLSGSSGTNPALAIVDAESLETKIVTYQPQEGQSSQIGFQSITPVTYDGGEYAYFGSFSTTQGGTYFRVDLSQAWTEEDYSPEVIASSERGFYWSGACCSGDLVVFGSKSDGTSDKITPYDGDAKLYAYNTSTGVLEDLTLSGSGSICTTVQYSDGYYYVVGKSGKLYQVKEDNGLSVEASLDLGGYSTCTPQIEQGKLYVGYATKTYSAGRVAVVNLENFTLEKIYNAPADVKSVKVFAGSDGDVRVYATYNKAPGGIYEVTAGYHYFTPAETMQQYCISTIATADGTDSVLYYTNDSCKLMAVKKNAASFAKPGKMAAPKVKKSSSKKVKVSWTKKTGIKGYQIATSYYSGKKYTIVKTLGSSYSSVKLTAKKKKNKYYKIRAYKVVGCYTIYGNWSSARKYKLK